MNKKELQEKVENQGYLIDILNKNQKYLKRTNEVLFCYFVRIGYTLNLLMVAMLVLDVLTGNSIFLHLSIGFVFSNIILLIFLTKYNRFNWKELLKRWK